MRTKRSLLVAMLALILAFVTLCMSAPEVVVMTAGAVSSITESVKSEADAKSEEEANKLVEPAERVNSYSSEYDETEIVVEDTAERTAASKTFVRADGSRVMQIYDSAVHYEKDGKFLEIDNTINEQMKTTANSFSVSFSDGNRKALASVSDEEHAIYMLPVLEEGSRLDGGIHVFNGNGELTAATTRTEQPKEESKKFAPEYASKLEKSLENLNIKESKLRESVEKSLEKNKSSIYYEDVFGDVDVQYLVEGNSLKENIIVESKQEDYIFEFKLNMQNLKPTETENGDIILTDSNNETVYTIPKGYMYDAEGVYSDAVEYELKSDKDGSIILSVIAENKFFATAAFPVVVDPTIIYDNSSEIKRGNYHDVSSSAGTNFETGRNLFGAVWLAYTYISGNSALTSALDNYVLSSAKLAVWRDNTAPVLMTSLKATNVPGQMYSSDKVTDLSHSISGNVVTIDILPYFVYTYPQGSITMAYRTYPAAEWIHFSGPVVTLVFAKATATATQDLGNGGTGIVNLLSGKLNYTYEDVSVNDGYMPIAISRLFDQSFGTSYQMGEGFRLNLQQRAWTENTSYVYESADGEQYFFNGNNGGVNRQLNMTFFGSTGNIIQIIDVNGNSLVFNESGNLIEIHQFPSRYESKFPALYLEITYAGSTSGQITSVKNHKTTLTFSYTNSRLSSINQGSTVLSSYVYDTAGRLTSAKKFFTTTANSTSFTYSTTGGTKISTVTNSVGDRAKYTYTSNKVSSVTMSNIYNSFPSETVNLTYTKAYQAPLPWVNDVNAQRFTTLITGNYVRKVAFSAAGVVADYCYEKNSTDMNPIAANAGGFDYLAFAETYKNTCDIVVPDTTVTSFTASQTKTFPSTGTSGTHSYAVSLWVKYDSAAAQQRFITIERAGSFVLENQTADWQLATIVMRDINLTSLEIKFTGGPGKYKLVSAVKLPQGFTTAQQSAFQTQYNNHGQPIESYRYNPEDGRTYITEYFYEDVQGTSGSSYPKMLKRVSVKAGATKNTPTEFKNQPHTFESETTYIYNSSNFITEIREEGKSFNTGTSAFVNKYTYNTAGQLTSHIDANGVETNFDTNGNSTVVGAPNSPDIVTTNTYKQGSGLLTSTATGGVTTDFGYTTAGQLSTVTHNGYNTSFGYNSDGSLYSISVPGKTLATYSSTSTSDKVTYGNNQAVTTYYDTKDRVLSIRHSDNSTSGFTYGTSTANVTNSGGTTQEWENAAASNNYKMINAGNTLSVGIAQNTGGEMTKSVKFDSSTIDTSTYNMDVFGRLGSIQKSGWNVNYTYDNANRPMSKKNVAGSRTFSQDYTYKTVNGNITQLPASTKFSNGSASYTSTYSYYVNGNLMYYTQTGSTGTQSYYYDSLDRLTTEWNAATGKQLDMTYNSGGNLTRKHERINGTTTKDITYSYGNAWKDLLTSVTINGTTYNMAYDNAGNPTTWRNNALTWVDGRQFASYGANTYKYDHNGNRTQKVSGGVTTNYYIEGSRIHVEKRGSDTIYYYYDDSGIAGWQYQGVKYLFDKNIFGDVIGMYRMSDGARVGGYSYNAWGELAATSLGNGSANASAILAANPFRYRGYYYDTDTKLYYLNSRYYDPEIGRFINADDPLMLYETSGVAQGANLFAYCLNNPVSYTDSTGMSWFLDFIGGVWNGFTGFWSGTWQAVTHPIDTVVGIWNAMTTDPLGTLYHMFDIVNPYEYYKAYQNGGWYGLGQHTGQALGVASMVGAVAAVKSIYTNLTTTKLYRAVGSVEYNGILASRRLSLGSNSAGKYFATSKANAARWGAQLSSPHMVAIRVSKAALRNPSAYFFPRLDAIGAAYHFSNMAYLNSMLRGIWTLY